VVLHDTTSPDNPCHTLPDRDMRATSRDFPELALSNDFASDLSVQVDMPSSTTFSTDSHERPAAVLRHSFNRLTIRDRLVLTVLGWSAGMRALLGAPPTSCGCRGYWCRRRDGRLTFIATQPDEGCTEHRLSESRVAE
jgi:hypothetical protein